MLTVRANAKNVNSSEMGLAGSSSDSMGKQVREPKEIPPSDQLKRHSLSFWVIVGALIFVNLWYDYYHPLGIIIDIIIAVALLIGYLRK